MNEVTMQVMMGLGVFLVLLLVFYVFGYARKKAAKRKINNEWRTIGGPVTVSPRGKKKRAESSDEFATAELSPEQRVEECMQAAETYCAFGHLDRAREEISSALAILPKNQQALLMRCKIEAQDGNRDKLKAALVDLAAVTGKTGPVWAEGVKVAQQMVNGAK